MDAGEVVLCQFRTRQARGCMTPLTLAIEKFIVGKLSGKSMQQVNFLGDDNSWQFKMQIPRQDTPSKKKDPERGS